MGSRTRGWRCSSFGLFHGFGLATKLQDFALSPNGLVPNILSFNVGVEIGQALALALVVSALAYWRTAPKLPAACVPDQHGDHVRRLRARRLSTGRVLDLPPVTTPALSLPAPPLKRLALASAGAVAVAIGILLVAVLPVEYGIDPLGTGRLLGLLPEDAPAVSTTAAPAGERLTPTSMGPINYFSLPFASDRATFELGPYDYVEYKYRLEQGASITFSWQASTPVLHDLHAEPDGGEEHAEVSFDKRQLAGASGTHTAPFPGLHGWMWENPGAAPVTVTITTTGFYSSATEFRPNRRRIEHPIVATDK